MATPADGTASTTPSPPPGRLRSCIVPPLLVALSCALAAMLVEGAVRWLPVDFHAAELERSNPPELLAAGVGRTTVLVLGDSFSADPDGWVPRVREGLGPGFRVINSAVSGFTSRPIRRMASRRIARFAPRVVVLQLYAGNDLLELAHPIRWTRTSPLRSLAWALSDAGSASPARSPLPRSGRASSGFPSARSPSPSGSVDSSTSTPRW